MKIKSKEQLPNWFDIAKYEEATDLGFWDWHVLLLRRFGIKAHQVNPSQDTSAYKGMETLQASLFDDPLLVEARSNVNFNELGDVGPPVRPFTVLDAYKIYSTFKHYLDKGALKEFMNISQSEATGSTEKEKQDLKDKCWYTFLLEQNHKHPITEHLVAVLIDAPQDQVVDTFTKFLADYVTNYPALAKENSVTEDLLHKWVKYRILPYIDLTLWEGANGVKLSRQLVADTLFYDVFEVSRYDRLRNNTVGLANDALTIETVFALRHQGLENVNG